jgi:CRISPR-associated endonuclease/helicase Cas3
MNDVRAVAELLLKPRGKLPKNINHTKEQIAVLAGMHDIGKVSPGFQAKCLGWLQKYGFQSSYGAAYEKDHSIVTQYTFQNILQHKGIKTESAELWAAILGAHHGRLHRLGIKLRVNDEEWEAKREEIISDFLGDTPLPDFPIENEWPFLWWFAGLISVSDWIGSAEEWFPVDQETTPANSKKNALHALNAIGFDVPKIKKGLSFGDAFVDTINNKPFVQNDLQVKAEQAIREPGLYIIEAPMGMGKTEAALWCAYQLMQKEKASGFYFALPTQATSNRIHIRVNEFLGRITENMSCARLVHAGSWLLDDIIVPTLKSVTNVEKESNRDAIDWFASRKRGLLAPFGVGTIDQALMSVIAVKHFFVRQFALAGKVVILDEVHSYDLYTGTLIKTFCERLLPLGCTLILLSATFTKEIKKGFIESGIQTGKEHYPLISGSDIKPLEVFAPKPKNVEIRMKSENDALGETLDKARHGSSVLWVCDTVNKAQQMFDFAKARNQTNIEIGLLHARFPVFRRQELEEYWMEKFGKGSKHRSGCVLFSTQIVEQSVDLDADFMVTELAPTDMLLQRMGRLWRHDRNNRPIDEPEFRIVAENNSFQEFKNASANEIKKMFGTKSLVYAPYVLLRTLMLWNNIKEIKLPQDIPGLLEQTYKPPSNEPESWQRLLDDFLGGNYAKVQGALLESNVWQMALDDEEITAKTRINNVETIQLILATQKDSNTLHLLNGECIKLKGDTFILSEARSAAKNIVKVPAYCFKKESRPTSKKLDSLVRGNWQVGFVEKGIVHCTYLKEAYTMQYTPEEGVEIMKTDQRNEVDYEPCD